MIRIWFVLAPSEVPLDSSLRGNNINKKYAKANLIRMTVGVSQFFGATLKMVKATPSATSGFFENMAKEVQWV